MLEQYSQEQLQEMSLVELAYLVLSTKREALSFQQLVNEVAALLNLSEEEVRGRIAQFYTDLNIDGRFVCIGENSWGLRAWYPYDQIEEEMAPVVRPKKKKKSVEDYDDFDDIDELDEDDFDYDLDEYDEEVEVLDDEDMMNDEDEFTLDDEYDDEIIDDEEFDLDDDHLDDELEIDETEEDGS